MGSEERKSKHREEIRKLIIEASMEIINSEGAEGFTIRMLAGRIEYSPRTIYLYYRDKSAVLDAVTDLVFRMTVDEMKKAGGSDMSPVSLAEIMVERHIRNALARPNLYEAVIANINSREHKAGSSEKELAAVIIDLFKSFLRPELANHAIESAGIFLSSLRSSSLLLIKNSTCMNKGQIDSYIETCKKILIGGLI